MNKFKLKPMASLLATGLFLSTQIVYAEETKTDNRAADQLDSVTVTGVRKRAQDPQKAPTASYQITGNKLEEERINDIQDLQQLVPGINIQSTDSADTQITIRGIGDGGGQSSGDSNIGMPSSVAVYVDNVYITRPGTLRALSDLDYIEVLSGARGTLFGVNSTGGVVDLHSKLPSFTPEAAASLSVGQRGYVTATATLSGPINDAVAARINVVHSETDGSVTNQTTGHKLNGSERNGVRGQFLIKPDGDRFNLRLSADFSEEKATPTSILYATHAINGTDSFATHSAKVGNKYQAGRTVILDDENSTHTVNEGVSAEANWLLENGYKIRSVSSYRNYDYSPDLADGLSVRVYSHTGTQVSDKTLSQDFRLDSPRGELFDYAAGLNYFNQDQHTTAHTRYASGTVAGLYLDSTSYNGLDVIRYGTLHDKMYSAFTQGTLHISPKFDATAGLRLNYNEKAAQFIRLNKSAFNSGYLQEYNLLPSATLNFKYQFTPDWSSYLALGYGEKSGGINVSAGAAAKAGYDSLIVDPEKTKSAELGFKGSLFGDVIGLKGDVFITEVSDFQTQGYDVDTQQSYLMNAGKFRSKGAEGLLSLSPTQDLKFNLSGVYNDARYTDYRHAKCAPEYTLNTTTAPAYCNLTGQRVFNAPKLTVNIDGKYSWHTAGGINPYVSGRYSFRSWIYGTVDNSALTRIAGYGLAAFTAGVSGKAGGGSWDASVWVNNAFNKTYYTRLVNGDYGSVWGWVGDPRTVGATIAYKY